MQINRRKNYSWLFSILFVILAATSIMILQLMFFTQNESQIDETERSIVEEDDAPESSKTPEIKPEKIDFQPIIDDWVKSIGGNKSVLVYDLDRDEIAGSYNVTKNYNTASLYKLFVVYEGYRRLESNEWQANESAGNTGYTVLECLDLAIRESYSPCAEVLWARIGHDELDEIIEEDFEIKNSDISVLSSNAEDIAKIMKLFYEHPDLKDEDLIARMWDSFLNQPATEYDWRQGLPSGFSNEIKVYNKVGWDYNAEGNYWNIYHDAAIIEYPEANRHFVVVVMTNEVSHRQIRNFGTMIEKTIKQSYD